VKADPDAQRRLLDLQSLDTALAQLRYRREHLPEHAQVLELRRQIAGLEHERIKAQVGVDDLDRDIERLERDTEQVRQRAARDQARLDAGTGPARELEALQHELGSLRRRQSELEDSELALMEQREQAQSAVDAVAQRLDEQRSLREQTESRRDSALAEIARDEEFKSAGRTPLADDLPADLIALYDRIRASSGGLGAALMRAGRCEGCRLEISAVQRAEIRAAAADDVIRCEECGRILVRTAESGL
jgi:uncharacterized protein